MCCLNFQGKMDDAFTLGHELGHAMHSHYSATAQPFETSHYRILAAEVASTVNETLMTHHLLKGETDRDQARLLHHAVPRILPHDVLSADDVCGV